MRRVSDETWTVEPLIIGFPYLTDPGTSLDFAVEYFSNSFYEHFVEDFDEFARVEDIPTPASPQEMEFVSEAAFKECLAS